ncbi:helix-turn-helix transcriptional regulator [Solwaraspora sp. WMMA2080]|uniref:helix-turn-helix domain-containing protein n=1 Tax=unclassified Solwaraspora TaxID=2627926 RepID=UPI00248BE1B3|nr:MULTISPECIES: helix-turn-helix transcriptional regulator [unclassified Solwaraspora]WBB95866.1 helix-turn-helix transcriptional regulator [Solwaraspora sp. WMMA2059]WBC20230.1 helix-turn-helix transcriptional regulator [Solwaraspora sp. WMMA2080]
MPEKRDRRTPTVRGRQLGLELKRLRTEARLTADQVAEEIGCSQGKISRIELAQTSVSKGDLYLMLNLFGVTDPARQEQYWRLAKEARGRGWWEDYRDTITSELSTYIAFETEASGLRTWSWGTINGLLQTEEYARATFTGEPAGRDRTPHDIDKHVEARLARQHRLTEDALKQWAILDESLLHRPIGGPEIFKAQLDRLLAPPSSVTIQVLKQQTVWHAGLNGAFTIMDFPEHPSVVFVETLTGDLDVEGERDVRRYSLAFDYLRATAAGVEESRELIARARDSIE